MCEKYEMGKNVKEEKRKRESIKWGKKEFGAGQRSTLRVREIGDWESTETVLA